MNITALSRTRLVAEVFGNHVTKIHLATFRELDGTAGFLWDKYWWPLCKTDDQNDKLRWRGRLRSDEDKTSNTEKAVQVNCTKCREILKEMVL